MFSSGSLVLFVGISVIIKYWTWMVRSVREIVLYSTVLKNKNLVHCIVELCLALSTTRARTVFDWCLFSDFCLKFGNRGSLEQHGFARNRMWIIDENPPPLYPVDSNGKPHIDLLLKSSEDDLKIWPHKYGFIFRNSLKE